MSGEGGPRTSLSTLIGPSDANLALDFKYALELDRTVSKRMHWMDARGILVLWNVANCEVEILLESSRVIHMSVIEKASSSTWLLSHVFNDTAMLKHS